MDRVRSAAAPGGSTCASALTACSNAKPVMVPWGFMRNFLYGPAMRSRHDQLPRRRIGYPHNAIFNNQLTAREPSHGEGIRDMLQGQHPA